MRLYRTSPRLALFVVALALVALPVLGGCSVVDRIRPGSRASADKPAADNADQVDVRQYLGPDYCPEFRVYAGADLLRTYQHGHQGDQKYVVWQASFGNIARECLYDLQGNVTLKLGISGRLVAGPKADGDTIDIPIKVAVVVYKESVLATERLNITATIPARGSTVFRQVKEITVPSPGRSRNYLIYVGFDVENWDPLVPPGEPASVAALNPPPVVEAPPVEEPAPAAPPPPKKTSNELPTPSGGFVLH